MSSRTNETVPFKTALETSDRALVGMWVSSGDALVAEICAGAGLDWLLIDAEHSPNGLESIASQLQATAAYSSLTVVRPPANDTVIIKQFLDLGAETLLIPMVDTAEQARAAVSAVHYPPRGIRGVGSALARSARWNRTPDYLTTASDRVTLLVQIESKTAIENVEEILAVDGVDGIFLGPADLAASLGYIGQQAHPEVLSSVARAIAAAKAVGKPVGVNAFVPAVAKQYIDDGINFILVGADVALVARGSEALAATYGVTAANEAAAGAKTPASY